MRNTVEWQGDDIYTMWCPIKVNSNTIELTVHTSGYCVQDLLCVIISSTKMWFLTRI